MSEAGRSAAGFARPTPQRIEGAMDQCIVVGSGPAGVAAARALIAQGRRVLMLDAGLRLEPERELAVEALAAMPPDAWDDALTAPLKEGVEVTSGGIPLKRLYGSDYPFRGTDAAYAIEKDGVDVAPSFALGGLSTVWGAGMLPFHDADMRDWPVSAADLAPHYRAVLSFVPLAGARDALEAEFPLYTDRVADLRPSRQAERFFRDVVRHRPALERAGITVGQSRVAVDSASDPRWGRPPCAYCGLCLYGCPYRLIYNAQSTVAELGREPGFTYRPDVIVERIEEAGGAVTVIGRERVGGAPVRATGDRVFLGAGILPTTTILLRSLGIFDRPVEIQDSTYFLLPMVRFRGVGGLEHERLHTLAQAFVVIRDRAICPESVGLSMYTYNDLTERALRASGGPLGRTLGPLWRSLAARLLVFGGYLHSRHSPRLTLTLRRDGGGGREAIQLGAVPNPASKALVRRVGLKLLAHARAFRGMPLAPLVRFSAPGRGFHGGGSFPMSAAPGPGRSDTLGRPYGFARVHVVDASTFPSIPATTITLPVMANAHRIASAAMES
jgi:choline dehydrogenase-like flavoprotein